jgi:hypothetical protein
MPFDPKIVPGDDDRFEERELSLPDDLVVLSEQLRDDALRLSACYPAGKTAVALPKASQISRRSWKSRLVMGSLAGSLVALSLLAGLSIYVGQTEVEPQRTGSPDHSVAASDRQPVFAPTALGGKAPENLAMPASFSGTMPPLTPAVFNSGVTGPEMEGWMDLRRETLAMDDESIEF